MLKILSNELKVCPQEFWRQAGISGGCYNTFLFKTQDDLGGCSPNVLGSQEPVIDLSLIRSHCR